MVDNYSCQSPWDINDINGFKMIWRRAKENANNCYNSQFAFEPTTSRCQASVAAKYIHFSHYLKPSITRMVTRLKCIKYDDVLDYSFMMSSQLYARVFFDFGDNSTDSNQFDWC